VISIMAVVTMLVSACAAPQVAPQIVKETVVVKEEVQVIQTQVVETVKEVEKVVEKEVEKLVEVQGAIPYPEAVPLDLGGVEVKRQPISEIVTYKALPEYKEPAWVTELVNQGKLPPVKDRLPKEPQVVLTSGMPDGIGVYGDVWRAFSACPTAGWNFWAGATQGWFGIESQGDYDGALVQTGPLWRADQDVEPYPQLAKSWEWSEDGKELTMYLVEGAKWSDGDPFDADDVMFEWEDIINDPNVNNWVKTSGWTWPDGSVAKLEKIDAYTIKWTFPVSKPVEMFYKMDEGDFSIAPSHLLKPLHPKYNPDMDYKEFENALPPDKLPHVTMGPWVPVEYKTDELLIMRRNPYYWKVDESGQQLPYLDEAVYQKGPSGTGRTLCLLAGGCDTTNVENPSTEYIETMKRAQEPGAHFEVSWGPETLSYLVALNQSTSLGVKDERDAAVRELFRNGTFRRALSHATDRDGLAQSIVRGPFLRAFPGGVNPGSPEFDRESVVYYPYSPETARKLLAELGFADTDNNGILNWGSGPLAGQDLVLAITANEDQQESNTLANALVSAWGEVGIKLNFRPVTSSARQDIEQSGEWDMHVWRGGQEWALPFTRCDDLAPIAKNAPSWHREGDKPRELQPFEEELVKLVTAYCPEQDPVKRKELLSQYNKIFTENNYTVGLIVGRYALALAKRFQNLAPGAPTFMYQWAEDNIMSEQIWTPADQQMPQIRPNTIPVYGE
jgi:peptide/nickel transport system substrate-binding protein